MVESSKYVKPWREAVKSAAMDAWPINRPSLEYPLDVEMIFTMRRPKSAKRGASPKTRPDLSKLVRSTEDALTDAGVWKDDALVVRCVSMKVYPGEHPDSLMVPGATIRIKEFKQ